MQLAAIFRDRRGWGPGCGVEPVLGRLPGRKPEEESTGGKAVGRGGVLGPRPVREQRCRPAGRELDLRGSHSRGLSGFQGARFRQGDLAWTGPWAWAPLEGEACPGAGQLPSAQGLSARDSLWALSRAAPGPGSEC